MEDGFYWVSIEGRNTEVAEVFDTCLLFGDFICYLENGAWNNSWGVVDIRFLSGKLQPPNA